MITNLNSVARNQNGKTARKKWRLMKVTRLPAVLTGRLCSSSSKEIIVIDIAVRCRVDLRAIVRPEGLSQ